MMLLIGSTIPMASVAHVVFAPPKVYRHPDRFVSLDLNPQKQTYLSLGQRSYDAATDEAVAFAGAVRDFLDSPDARTFQTARQSWIKAHGVYGRTEVFRFNDGPIDAPATSERREGPELHINAWPVDESTIDSVVADRRSGLIHNRDFEITADAIRAQDQVRGEFAITTGWHAIEFLLWGQDSSDTGPGARSHRDFLPGNPIRERRRRYLLVVTDMLVADIRSVAEQWHPDGSVNFRSQLDGTDAFEVMGRALHGATSFASIELYGERFSVGLDSRAEEDEHSCFSDTTVLDLRNGLQGLQDFLSGTYGDEQLGPGLLDVLEYQDPGLANRVRQAMASATTGLAAIELPFDQLIRSPMGSPERMHAERTLSDIRALAQSLKASAETLGLRIVVPGI